MALVHINREKLGAPGDFMTLNKRNLELVLNELTHSELRLYLFLVSNRDGYTMPFSKQLIQNRIGLSKNGFYLARDGLIKKGFLVFNLTGDEYFFYEQSLQNNISDI